MLQLFAKIIDPFKNVISKLFGTADTGTVTAEQTPSKFDNPYKPSNPNGAGDDVVMIAKPERSKPLRVSPGKTQLTIDPKTIRKTPHRAPINQERLGKNQPPLPPFYTVPNQLLIVTPRINGQANNLVLGIDSFLDTDFGAELREKYGLEEVQNDNIQNLTGQFQGEAPFELRSFIHGGETRDFIRTFNRGLVRTNANSERPHLVLVAPNFILGANPWGIDADPWGIDADPWGIDADPWGIDADARTNAPLPLEAVNGPWDQWALRSEHGIGLCEVKKDVPIRTIGEQAGDGVPVFIFDTSPFDPKETGVYETAAIYDRNVHIYQPELAIEIEEQHKRIKEHGFFAAGLVRLVAPNAELHLVRVLNRDGVGDLLSMVVVLNDVLTQLKRENRAQGAVFNLSLSLTPLVEEAAQAQDFALTEAEKQALRAQLPPAYHPLIGNDTAVAALNLVLSEADRAGVTIICASGNESDLTHTENRDYDAAVPAQFGYTVAVGASDSCSQRSCFSNGDKSKRDYDGVFAPGGSGTEATPFAPNDDNKLSECEYPFPSASLSKIEAKAFLPKAESPSRPGGYDNEYAVTSVLSSGYIGHWLGTSFSAPLVSGIAALVIEKGKMRLKPAAVKKILINAQDSKGVIKVTDALN